MRGVSPDTKNNEEAAFEVNKTDIEGFLEKFIRKVFPEYVENQMTCSPIEGGAYRVAVSKKEVSGGDKPNT